MYVHRGQKNRNFFIGEMAEETRLRTSFDSECLWTNFVMTNL